MIWLNKSQSAAHELSYSGHFVYQQGAQLRTSRIAHWSDGKHELEKLEILDGEAREYIRSNGELVSYFPGTKTILREKRVIKEVFPSMLALGTGQLVDYYEIRMLAPERVAGYECHMIALEPKDAYRYGYQFCVETKTGLLLKAQVLNEQRNIVEQIAFSALSIGNIQRKSIKPSFSRARTASWRSESAQLEPAQSGNLQIAWMPPGFKKTHEVTRLVKSASTLADGNAAGPGAEDVPHRMTQIVYSDGLAAISVFIEKGNGKSADAAVQRGATNMLGKRLGDFSLMIIGEVPMAALKKISNSIEYRP